MIEGRLPDIELVIEERLPGAETEDLEFDLANGIGGGVEPRAGAELSSGTEVEGTVARRIVLCELSLSCFHSFVFAPTF